MKPEAIIEILIEQAADVDDLVERHEDEYTARVLHLLDTPADREEGLWVAVCDALDLDYDATIDSSAADIGAVPPRQRSSTWADTVAAMTLACEMQALAEVVLPDLLALGDSAAQEAERISDGSSRAEMRTAAKIGISKSAVEARRAARRAQA